METRTNPERALEAVGPALRTLLAGVGAAIDGRDGDVFVVGGFARDLLANRTPVDLDLAVGGDPGAVAELLAGRFSGSAFAIDEKRRQYRIALPDGQAVRCIDVGQVRGAIEADLGRRDFTVDAMAAALDANGCLGRLIDPFGGAADLQAGILKLVSESALTDDPLRLLRAARIATELEFGLEAGTEEAVRRLSARLKEAASERQREELVRILATPRAAQGLRLLDRLRLLPIVAPEMTATRGVDQPKEHFYDVFDHSLEAVAVLDSLISGGTGYADLAVDFRELLEWFPVDAYFEEGVGGHSRLVLTKLAALYHDVAKPATRAADESGRVRFLGHPDLGAKTAARACRRLRFGSRETRFVSLLVEEHLRPAQLSGPSSQGPSDRAIYRFFRDLSEAAPACLVLALADAAAAAGPRLRHERWRAHVAYVGDVLERHARQGAARTGAPRLVPGDTIMSALGIGAGPVVGRLLEAIDEAVGAGEITTVEEALDLARTLQREQAEKVNTVEAGPA